MGSELSQNPSATNTPPHKPARPTAFPSFCRAQSYCRKKPVANPANANADQGNTGNTHGCGAPNVCTPSIYDSSHHRRQWGCHVVQSSGVKSATTVAQKIEMRIL